MIHATMESKTQNPVKERYFIKFNGMIVPGKTIDEVASDLSALFKCNLKNINRLFDGKVHIIKKGLGWKDADKYQEILRKKGAVTDIGVMMDARSLKSALVPVRKKISDQEHKANHQEDDALYFNFNRIRIFPTFFYLPHSEPFFLNGSAAGTVNSLKLSINWIITFLLAIPVGFYVEWRFLYFFSNHVTTGIISTISSIALLGAILFYLPNLMRPKRAVRVKCEFEESEIDVECLQIKRFPLFRKKFQVVDDYGGIIGILQHDLLTQQYMALDANGTIIFSAEEEIDTSNIVINAITDIRDEILNFKILDVIKSIWGVIKGFGQLEIFHQTGKNLNKEDFSKFESEEMLVVRDGKGAVVGRFLKNQNCPFILFQSRLNCSDKCMIIAFYMLLSGL